MRVCLYTALYGDYDTLRPVMPQAWDDGRADCLAFTDQVRPGDRAEGWQVIVTPRPEAHPRMQAKFFKLNPHKCLRDYDLSVWVDASLRVHSPHLVRDLARYVKESAVAFFPHRWRTRLADELAAHLPLRKYAGLPIREQVASYFAEGYAEQTPLLECTCIVRRHNDRAVRELDEAWWGENQRWTYADQLSLPYVLWKLGTPYTQLPFNLDEQPWFRWATWRDD
jgi:hypothetical protein